MKNLKYLWQNCVCSCLMAFALSAANALIVSAQNEMPDSPTPILISQTDSTRALASNADDWRGGLPKESIQSLLPGANSRVVLYATNLNLTSDEGANAFRVYAESSIGKIYRLKVENIQPLIKEPWIYGVTVKLSDENGYNGQPTNENDILLRLTWRGLTSNRVVFNLGERVSKVTVKNDGAIPTPAPTSAPITEAPGFAYNNLGDRGRFMEQAAFGSSQALDLRLRQIGLQRWVNEQFAQPFPGFEYPALPLEPAGLVNGVCPPRRVFPNCDRDFFSNYQMQNWMFKEALYGNDQLRRRVSWTLSQIWVTSFDTNVNARSTLEYVKILDRHAFGNYRNLMREMTLNLAMGEYLDMSRSTRRYPNENYPREILQLFTVGLDMLNQDGTPMTVNGNRIPTYDQDKINQFTKVFTGWTRCQQAPPTCPNATSSTINWIDPMILSIGAANPSDVNPGNHDLSAKILFDYPGAPNSTIPACTNCTTGGTDPAVKIQNIKNYANDSLNKTLDNIYNHPNVAPFVSKSLIQQLVTGDPTPAYVARVASVFRANLVNPNQMQEVIKAILFDPEARGSLKTDPDYGKLREPFQFATNFLKQLNVGASRAIIVNGQTVNPPSTCQNRSDGVINSLTGSMSQNVWQAPSVFNYYPPNYIVPGTDLTGPEFGIYDTGTAVRRINFINTMVYEQIKFQPATPANPARDFPCGTSIDLTEAINWSASDSSGAALTENLNLRMLHGQMSPEMKQELQTAINAIPAAANSHRERAQQAIYIVATSAQYQVQR